MSRPDELHMHDPDDKEIHRKEGVDPYPVPKDAKMADRPEDDEATSTPDNAFERGLEHEDGEYIDAVDKMKKTLKDDGSVDAWRKGQTQNQGAPRR